MKTLSLMILLLTLVACGKESKTNSSSSSTQLSYNGLQLNSTTLIIPTSENTGGTKSLRIGSNSYSIDINKSSTQVLQYLYGLEINQIPVTPKSNNQLSKEYNAGYVGVLEQGACMSNPMATCTNAVLTQLFAF